jgi:hypothetical protein
MVPAGKVLGLVMLENKKAPDFSEAFFKVSFVK